MVQTAVASIGNMIVDLTVTRPVIHGASLIHLVLVIVIDVMRMNPIIWFYFKAVTAAALAIATCKLFFIVDAFAADALDVGLYRLWTVAVILLCMPTVYFLSKKLLFYVGASK